MIQPKALYPVQKCYKEKWTFRLLAYMHQGFFQSTLKRLKTRAIYRAILDKDCNRVRELIQSGTEIDKEYCDFNPLGFAAYRGTKEIIEVLLEMGANINYKNSFGYTPLTYAVDRVSPKIIDTLLKAGANIKVKAYDDRNLLALAVVRGHIHLISMLVDAGADINALDDEGYSVIDIAEQLRRIKAIKLLEELGAKYSYEIS
ncbi:MAG: ankyrin repeat domain-containing protein [Cyanobacteriota bacterium]|nr:ankyrin repeat domain-containing protein [Cyanobacteriota bacterium]